MDAQEAIRRIHNQYSIWREHNEERPRTVVACSYEFEEEAREEGEDMGLDIRAVHWLTGFNIAVFFSERDFDLKCAEMGA